MRPVVWQSAPVSSPAEQVAASSPEATPAVPGDGPPPRRRSHT
jgi:hypothetical protein